MKFFKILLIFSLLTFSQNKKLQFAESYYESGDYENAARLFLELLESDKDNPQYFDGVFKTMYSMSKFSELLPIAQEFAKEVNDPRIDAKVGDLQWKSGNSGAAIETWNKALNTHNKMIVFETVAEAQIANRQYQDALNTYDLARSKTRNQAMYHEEVLKLLISIGNYKRGMEELIQNIEAKPNYPKTQGRIFAFMINDSAKTHIKNTLTKLSNENSNNIFYQELLAWYYRETNEFDGAFELNIRLDKLKRTNGYQIYKFGEEARKDDEFGLAIKAYEYIIDNQKKYQSYYNKSLIGYAKAIESKYSKQGSLSVEEANEIISRYDQIIKRVKNPEQKADALYRKASIYYNGLNDEKTAENIYTLIIKDYPRTIEAAKSERSLAEIALSNDDFTNARTYYRNIISLYKSSFVSIINNSKFMLAKLEYFQGNFDKAKELLKQIKDIKSDVANNFLELFFFLENYKESEEDLKKYAMFEFALFKEDLKEIKMVYSNFVSANTNSNLYELATVKLVKALSAQETLKSIEIANKFLFDNASSIYMDQMLLILADCYEIHKDEEKAIETYSKLLVDYPNSIYLQKARDNIRILRGEIN